MKKNIYLLITALSLTTVIIKAQTPNAIPNGNFESWTSATFDRPTGFWGSNAVSFFRNNAPFNVVKTTDAQHGSFAVQLTTNIGSAGDTNFAYIVNSSNTGNGSPCQWMGGLPFTQVPTGLKGYYKSSILGTDTGIVLVAFKHGNPATCLGMYVYRFSGVHSTYTPFELTFTPPISGTPDTMIFVAVSSNAFTKKGIQNGSMLQLDSISLTGITPQPAALNGDFENWQSVTVNKPNNWYMQSDDQGDGVYQTTDKKAGNYAVELKTFLGQRGNSSSSHPAAQAGGVSTGYWPKNCSGPCVQKGGYYFTKQIDTLCFYYKYAPSGNDTANVNMSFKKAGTNVWNGGTNVFIPASTYQYVEVPFNIPSPVDTVIVSLQSSSWRDSTTNFIGTDFKVDEMHFKSQALNTGIKLYDASAGIKVFPNPSSDGNFTVSNVQYNDLVRVLNIYGQEVNADVVKQNGAAQIQINTPGAYFVYVNARGKITTLKVIVAKE